MKKASYGISIAYGVLQILLGVVEFIDYMTTSGKKENWLKLVLSGGFMAVGALNCVEAEKRKYEF